MTQLSEPEPRQEVTRAALPPSPRFDFEDPSDPVIWKKPLHKSDWHMQSYAFDNTLGDIYFVQRRPRTTNGDLWVTRTDRAGNRRASMLLKGFGHGVQIAVEPDPGENPFLWAETHAGADGYGTRVGRFRFVNGATITSADAQDRTPALDSLGERPNPQPAIDPYNGRLLVRYRDDQDRRRIAVFQLSDATDGRLGHDQRLAECLLPDRGDWAEEHPFQGFTAFGQFAYLLEGEAGVITSYLTCIDLNSGQVVQDRFHTQAGRSLPNREPEGMAIQLLPGEARLTLGLTSHVDGSYTASIFHKNEFE
jgi:hypothetical protein